MDIERILENTEVKDFMDKMDEIVMKNEYIKNTDKQIVRILAYEIIAKTMAFTIDTIKKNT